MTCPFCQQPYRLEPKAWCFKGQEWEVCHACAAEQPAERVLHLRAEPSPYLHDKVACDPMTCAYCWAEGRAE